MQRISLVRDLAGWLLWGRLASEAATGGEFLNGYVYAIVANNDSRTNAF
jgi:hypothetical protein